MFLRAGAALCCAAGAWAQDALNPAMPLAPAPALRSPGMGAMTATAAHSARELGISSIAAEIYRDLLKLPGADRAALTLDLASALLEAGGAEEAAKALEGLAAPRSAAWHLRAGLAALQQKKYEAMRAAVVAIREAELSVSDYPWYWFLQGAYVDIFSPQEMSRANDFYTRAENAAPNGLARARFQLAAEEVRLRRGAVATPEQLQAALRNYEGLQGTSIGYASAQTYALMLWGRDQRSEAIRFLQMAVPGVPPMETRWWDDLRLTLGIIDDRGRGFSGRKALTELVEAGRTPLRQQQGLQLLWEASQAEPARAQLRVLLDRLIAAPAKHPIRESVLFYRAQLALLEKNHEQAAANANLLLTEFPESALRAHAYGLLTQLAWEQRRYRLAADSARKARAEMAAAKRPEDIAARAEFGVVEAEAWFRAGQAAGDRNDFRNAADAYAAILSAPPAGVKPGDLMLQCVLAEIRAGSAEAANVLDRLAASANFDLENRWQAEWSLAQSRLTQNQAAEAYRRINALLETRATEIAALKPDLRAKLAWLRVRLAFEAGQFEQALTLADGVVAGVADAEEALRSRVVSMTLLDKARTQLELRREPDALATLTKVRTEFPKSEAAIDSYLTEADYYAGQGKIVEAQKRLISLTNNPDYKNHERIPWAYFQLAEWSEQLGQTKDLREANVHIENLIDVATKGNQLELVFRARLKQAEIWARLNDFPRAQHIYEALGNMPASPENQIFARFALARTHNALAGTDPLHAERAERLFEELRDNVGASADVRVEAGYYLGALLKSRGKEDRAARAWWEEVITPFLVKDNKAFEPGAKRPFWLARTLIELGALLAQQGRLDEARTTLGLVERYGLEGTDLAKAALARLEVAKPAQP